MTESSATSDTQAPFARTTPDGGHLLERDVSDRPRFSDWQDSPSRNNTLPDDYQQLYPPSVQERSPGFTAGYSPYQADFEDEMQHGHVVVSGDFVGEAQQPPFMSKTRSGRTYSTTSSTPSDSATFANASQSGFETRADSVVVGTGRNGNKGEKRKERNRLAAKKSRERRLNYISELETQLAVIRDQNVCLKMREKSLKDEVQRLRTALAHIGIPEQRETHERRGFFLDTGEIYQGI